ncbi:MAG: hypothetical protein ACI35W_00195 [Anaeroplasmataceae bacterium]
MKITITKILKIIGIILSLILVSLPLFFKLDSEVGLIIEKPICYIPIVIFSALFILCCVEFIRSRPFVRIIYLFIAMFSLITLIKDGIEQINASIWFFSIIYVILTIVSIFRGKESDKFILPVGMVSLKQTLITYGILIAAVILSIAFYYWWWVILGKNFFGGILIIFAFLMIIYIPVLVFLNPFRRIVNDFNNNPNYNTFSSEVNKLLENNLNSDTRIYVNSILCNYMYYKNPDEAIALFNSLERPKNKAYASIYDNVSISNELFSQNYDKAMELIAYLEQNPKTAPNAVAYRNYISIYNTTDYLDNIEGICPTNTTNKYLNIINEFNLMNYYNIRGYKDDAVNLANKLLDYSLDLDYINEKASKIINS